MRVQLTFSMQQQQQSYWSWAAVAVSIANYYAPGSGATQCSLANWAFRLTICCMEGGPAVCNQPYPLSNALLHYDRLNTYSAGAISFNVVKAQLDAGRPVGVTITWIVEGGTHVVVITGYDDTDPAMPVITLEDPWMGTTVVQYANFPGNYKGGATWESTCLTK